ncbi:spatacsin-like [Liolophura sinensis]|uniref:spatacsin-like n=1 Tax=Liolophura sinensis TaxID=3198878 RepID=UPI003158F295
MRELPYFSHPDLVTKYAPVVSLRFTYYLRQGRPSFAFLSFLAQELDSGTTTVTKKRVNWAYRVATVLAIRHVSNEQVVAGCTAFVEMLGEDSSHLRTQAQVTHTILRHRNSGLSGSTEDRRNSARKNEQDTIDLMLSCLRRPRSYGGQVLSCLEEAVMASILREKHASVSFEAALQWNLVLLFCHHSRLPYSTCFLEACARDDQWLPFIWFSQMHQYPKEQLHGLLHKFKSRPLREHLHYVIENAQAKSLEQSSKPTSFARAQGVQRDIRSSLYTRIGLAKITGETKEHDSSSSEEEDGHLAADEEDEIRVTDDEVFSVKVESAPDDVFGVVYAAVTSKCQWKSLLSHSIVLRNPLFAVLAASFPESTRLACLSSWLVAMMDPVTSEEFLAQHDVVATRWTLIELRILVDIFIKKSWTTALATGFDIFQMDSPLLPFLMFYAEFKERKQYAASRKMLESFKEAMFAFRQNGEKSGPGPVQPDASYILGNIDWFEQVSYSAICLQLTRGRNQYETMLFLGVLEQVNIAPVFSFPVPDYSQLHKLYQIAVDTGLELACIDLLESASSEYQTACKTAVVRLKERSLYDEARKFATIAGLDHQHVTVAQVTEELSEMRSGSLWRSAAARRKLWQNCLDKFRQHQVQGSVIADFFQTQINECGLEKREEAYLYQLSHDSLWEGLEDGTERQREDIYIRLWRCKLEAKLQQIQGLSPKLGQPEEVFDFVDSKPGTPNTPTSPQWGRHLLQYGVMPQPGELSQEQREVTLTDMEKQGLDELLKELLGAGQIQEAFKLASVFQHYNRNLAIILSCMRLAKGEVTVAELDSDIRTLVFQTSPPTGRIRRQSLNSMAGQMTHSQSLSSLPGFLASAVEATDPDREETVNTLEKLLNHCEDGYFCCLRVFTAYRISMVLGMDYEDVMASDDFTILEMLLVQTNPHRFILAKDYLKTGDLSDAAVAGFLSDAIVHSLKIFNSSGDASSTSSSDLIFHPAEGATEFSNLVRLCHDPSMLGDRLLDAVAALAGNEADPSQAVLSIQTELLIRAHDCHSLACNMEGISNILRAARVLTECLARAEEFPLMIRLLTGVGRYSEMSYIFDALKQNHQFELLLRKGMEKEDRLKVAMLDYLKRFHSTDSDSFTMVALNFTMYREIAQMLEECAYRQLAKLKTQPLENSSDTKTSLEKVVQYLSDAADSYIKDNCMRHAQSCVKQARLVALQSHLLSSGVHLINLSPTEASMFIRHHARFTEAYIVSDAYNRRTDWAAALCTNFLINGDMKYFTEFKNYVKLTPSLISETVERYEQLANKPSHSLQQVQKLLSCCRDVKVKYQLAKDLGMKEIVTKMENGECGAYLLDIFL